MKNIKQLFLAFSFLLSLIGCKKENEAFEEKLFIGAEYMEVSSKSEKYTFDLLSNSNVEVSTDAEWIQLDSVIYHKGKNKIGFSVVKNEDDERTGVVQVRVNESITKEVLVVQESGKVPVFYVKVDGTGSGKSWNDATDLTTAIEKSTTNSIIYIAEGVYKPTKTIRNGDSSEESDKTIEISKNISLIGGFEKDAMVGAQPNSTLYKTIFDGALSSAKSAFHTVVVSAPFDTESKVYLEGITITGGNATDRSTNITIGGVKYSRGQGGGMLIANAKVEMKNVEVVDNKATADKGTAGYGAGIYSFNNAQLIFQNVKINNNNNISNNGGGIWLNGGSLVAFNSEFNGNYARGTAGGIHGFPDANVTLYNCEVLNNSNTSYGAGVYMRENSNVIMVNCLIAGNKSTSTNGGGGVMLYDASNANIISSTITANDVAGPGAGVYRRSKTNNLTVYNSIISGNKQASSSTDVDSFSDNANVIPSIKNSITNTAVYGTSGTIESNLSFSPTSMFGTGYLPIGSTNPALTYGVNSTQLVSFGSTFTPALDEKIGQDINGVNRSSAIMGYKVK